MLGMRDVITRFWCGLLDEDQVSALWDGGGEGSTRGGADHYFLTDMFKCWCRLGICASRLPFARQTLRRTLTLVLQHK